MKSIKILLPAALTFTMAMGISTTYAQSNYSESTGQPINNTIVNLIPKKAIGLNYTKTLLQINTALTEGVKADHTIDFQGKVMVDISLNADGKIEAISYDKELSPKLINKIEHALTTADLQAVTLNGIAKAQTFKIPLRIK